MRLAFLSLPYRRQEENLSTGGGRAVGGRGTAAAAVAVAAAAAAVAARKRWRVWAGEECGSVKPVRMQGFLTITWRLCPGRRI